MKLSENQGNIGKYGPFKVVLGDLKNKIPEQGLFLGHFSVIVRVLVTKNEKNK